LLVWPHLLWLGVPLNFLYGPLLHACAHPGGSPPPRAPVAQRQPGAAADAWAGGAGREEPAHPGNIATGASRRRRWHRASAALHGLPFALCVLLLVPTYARDAAHKLALVRGGAALPRPVTGLQLLHIGGYLLVACWRARRHPGAAAAPVRLRVLLTGTAAAVATAALRLAVTLPAWAPAVVGSAMILAVGYHLSRAALPAQAPAPACSGPAMPAPPATSPPPGARTRYARSGLAGESMQELAARLHRLMRSHEPHLDSMLTLGKLAGMLGVRPEWLSQVLSQALHTNFLEYVNRHRIAAAREQLRRSRERPRVGELAYAVGFNARSTFYSAFRRETGQTPLEFWQAQRAAPDDALGAAGEQA
jgi:AraC-like DNA-binding protein